MAKPFDPLTLSRGCQAQIRRAVEACPGASLPEALVTTAERGGGPLSSSSVAVYCHEARRILTALAAAGVTDGVTARSAEARIVKAFRARDAGENVPSRTSALKEKTMTPRELRVLFRAVKEKALGEDSREVALVGLLIVVLVLTGLRPVELTTAEVKGNILRARTAKRGVAAHPWRYFSLAGVPEPWVRAIAVAAEAYAAPDVQAFYRRHRALSQILGRVSDAVLGRRISLSTLRHVTAATWKRAGLTAREIMDLLGHVRPYTQSHYAGRSSGHAGALVLRSIAPKAVPEGLFTGQSDNHPLIGARRGARVRFEDRLVMAVAAHAASSGTQTADAGVELETVGEKARQVRPLGPIEHRPFWQRPMLKAASPPLAPQRAPAPGPVTPPTPAPLPATPSPRPAAPLARRGLFTGTWQDRQRRQQRQQINLPSAPVPPAPPEPPVSPVQNRYEDEFDLRDMPFPEPPRPTRPVRPTETDLAPDRDPMFDALLAKLIEGGDPVDADWAMPRPNVSGFLDDPLAPGPRQGTEETKAPQQPAKSDPDDMATDFVSPSRQGPGSA